MLKQQLLFAIYEQYDGGFYYETMYSGRRPVRAASRPQTIQRKGNIKMVPAPEVVELYPLTLPRLPVRMQQLESISREFHEIPFWYFSIKFVVISNFWLKAGTLYEDWRVFMLASRAQFAEY